MVIMDDLHSNPVNIIFFILDFVFSESCINIESECEINLLLLLLSLISFGLLNKCGKI